MDPDRSRRWYSAPAPTSVCAGKETISQLRVLDESAIQLVRPLLRPAPRSAMVFPLVVLIAVLPGLVALNTWDLTPPGPLWGLRGLAVLDGLVLDQTGAADEIKPTREAAAFRAVAYQPPLYAWLVALGFWLSANYDPLASVLPSYVFGALAVLLVYLHGRLWHGAGLGLIAALLVGFNQNLLLRMQEGAPTTLALCGILAALLAYGQRERVLAESVRPWPWAGPRFWAIAGGLAVGLALLALGGLALIVIPIVLLHRYYLRAASSAPSWPMHGVLRWLTQRQNVGLQDGTLAVLAAAAVFLPWLIVMVQRHGWHGVMALEIPPDGLVADHQLSLLPRLIDLAPATLALAILGAVHAIRLALIDETNSCLATGASLWVIWLAVAALSPTIWRHAPRGELELVLLVPLCLLAAQTIADLVNRKMSVRIIVGLAPATAVTIAWWASADLHKAVDDMVHGRADVTTVLGLHLVFDLVVVSVWGSRSLYRWARHRDDRQRWILASFLLVVMIVTIGEGLREVLFRHDATQALLSLRTMILRRNRDNHFQVVAVVSPSSAARPTGNGETSAERSLPGGRLRFILKTALPRIQQRDLTGIDELFGLPERQRLVILAGAEQHLSSADQFKLGLEAIHPGRSGILDAYATAQNELLRR